MTTLPVRYMALALGWIVLGSCSDTISEPETSSPPYAPALAVASNSWITRANMPTDRSNVAVGVVTNAAGQSVLYAIGGDGGGILSKVEAYNVATNTWSTKAPLPSPRYWTNGAGVIGGKIYVSGGILSNGNVQPELYMYNPATNTWTRKRDMPTRNFRGVTGVINGKLYVLTGCDDDACDVFFRVAFYRYNPTTNTWTTLPAPAREREWGFGGVIGGKFYVTGGYRELDVYDPATNRWTTKASMPQARWLGASAVMGNKLYVIGGFQRTSDGATILVRTTSVYDAATNSWTTKAPLPAARTQIAGSRVMLNGQSRIEVVGGNHPGNNLAYVP